MRETFNKIKIWLREKRFKIQCPDMRCFCCSYYYWDEENNGYCDLKSKYKLDQSYKR